MIVDVARRDEDIKIDKKYTDVQKALNFYIRETFPEWGCKSI